MGSTIQVLTPIAKKKGLALEFHYDPSPLPPIRADRRRAQQILWNLIGNGLKFTDSGGVYVRACVSHSGKEVEVSVSDTGIGIAERDIPSVFKEFSQISGSTKRIYEGTGLGVPISKELVQRHGGRFDVWSEVDKGSTFSFTLLIWDESLAVTESDTPRSYLSDSIESLLPVGPASSMSPSLSTPRRPRVSDEPCSPSRRSVTTDDDSLGSGGSKSAREKSRRRKKEKSGRILCVDDNDVNLLILGRYLSASHHLLTCTSGPEALALLKKESVDLVLMDVMMPEMDGYETTEKIREMRPNLPVLFVSAKAEESRGYECGGCGYILKPVDRKKLLEIVAKYLKK